MSSESIVGPQRPLARHQFLHWEDQMFSSFVFDSYETNRIWSTNSAGWIFGEENVVRGAFLLTGQSYLQLSDSVVRGSFKPIEQRPVSPGCDRRRGNCWRPTASLPHWRPMCSRRPAWKLPPYTLQVKYQTGDWSFVEVLVDFEPSGNFTMSTFWESGR